MENMAKGSRAELEEARGEEIKSGTWNSNSDKVSFQWNNESTPKEREIMIDAVKYFSPSLEREELEQLKIYAEFVYSNENGFRFIDISDRDFWTELNTNMESK